MLVISGRLNWIIAVIGSLVPLLPKLFTWVARHLPVVMMLVKRYRSAKEKSDSPKRHGQQSTVESLYLIMILDHDTGGMDGRVKKGEFQGRLLSSMSPDELRNMLHNCEDDETVSLLMSYMDRYSRRDNSQDNTAYSERDANGPSFMSVHEAREILGITENANKDEIINAHRRLIQKIHPDRGGSEYLAIKINRAKDVLLTAL